MSGGVLRCGPTIERRPCGGGSGAPVGKAYLVDRNISICMLTSSLLWLGGTIVYVLIGADVLPASDTGAGLLPIAAGVTIYLRRLMLGSMRDRENAAFELGKMSHQLERPVSHLRR